MSGQIISIVNQKGGVGKTTTAINLASYLSELKYKTLLIDFDPQANATSGIGLKQEEISNTVYDLLLNNKLLNDVLYPTPFENLHIIPASPSLAGAEVELAGVDNREAFLTNAVEPLKKHYDFIIIDCAPSLGLLTVNALSASDKTLIPVQCEYFALEGIAQLINTLNLIKENINPKLSIAGIVLTMYDPRTSLNKLVVNNARIFFKDLVFNSIIPRNIRLAEAPSHGLPIVLYNPASKGSMSYLKLAKEFVSRVQ